MEKDIIILNGKSLTIKNVIEISRHHFKVEISDEAMETVNKARKLVYKLADKDIPIYGFNRGVGVNKDRQVTPEFFQDYNRRLILSHCVAVDPEASEEVVRAALLVRLNTLLLGCTGIQPAIVTMYKEFLNQEIHPIIPERGSVGVGDITCLSHIGLAMIGEGEVHFKGKRMPAYLALEKAGLKPIILGPKDGLAIVSSNALSAGEGAIVLHDIEQIVDMADMIYALSLEGLKGNVSPLDEAVVKVRAFQGQAHSAKLVRKYLENSYLWSDNQVDTLQDPLSFRGACQVHGSVRDALAYVANLIEIQLNSSDDNPCLIYDEERMISCSNYEVTNWVLGFEMLGVALSHLSKIACFRTIKLGTPQFTKLSRFLTPDDNQVIAFGTIQKTFAALDTEIRHLSNPATADYFSLSGDVEDHANNSTYVVKKTGKIVDNLNYILGIEAMHAVQAIDLREEKNLGTYTKLAYDAIRAEIPFLEVDRNLSIDIKKVYNLLKSGYLLNQVNKVYNEPNTQVRI